MSRQILQVHSNISRSNRQIEERINFLKEKISKVQSSYILELYGLLKEIYLLRRKQFPRYTTFDLCKEDGINFRQNQIKYLFKLDHLSPKSKFLIEKNKIKVNTMIRILYKSVVFCNNHAEQDRVVERYLSGELTMNNIVKFPLNAILTSNRNPDEHLSSERKKVLESVYQLKCVAKDIKDNKGIIKKNMEKFEENIHQLHEAVDTLVMYRCPYCRKKLKLSDLKDEK